jgi:hypothetical protein
MKNQDWLIKEAMKIAEETLTKPPGRYRAEEVLKLYIRPNFTREQVENMKDSCELLGIDFDTFLEQHYTGRRRSFFWPEEYFFLFFNPKFKHALENTIASGVNREQLADYILYVLKDSIEHRINSDEHYIRTIKMIGRISFDEYARKIEEVKNYRKKNSSSRVRKMKKILRESAERIGRRFESYGLEHLMFDVRYYGSLYFGDPSDNPDIDALIYFEKILPSPVRRFVASTLRVEEFKMLEKMERRIGSFKEPHYHAVELEFLKRRLDRLMHDVKVLIPEHKGNFVIDFSRAPSELFLSESIIPDSSLTGFEEAK